MIRKKYFPYFVSILEINIYCMQLNDGKSNQRWTMENKPQQEGIPTKPGYKELFILILQKTSNNN